MLQLRHPQAVDPARRFSRIIKRDQGEVVATVRFGKVLRCNVRQERPDVPRPDAQDVGHG